MCFSHTSNEAGNPGQQRGMLERSEEESEDAQRGGGGW